ncbi:hypothetical protein [Roseibium marinum]|uniref:hypothetical protein n=1 Tax=Roseibium marinum TaxID=281252 RepID=UPI0011AFA43E|nr:hypothetical protein [Roseibium marinum]
MTFRSDLSIASKIAWCSDRTSFKRPCGFVSDRFLVGFMPVRILDFMDDLAILPGAFRGAHADHLRAGFLHVPAVAVRLRALSVLLRPEADAANAMISPSGPMS